MGFIIAPDQKYSHHFEMRVENITFLGQAVIAPLATPTPGTYPLVFTSFSLQITHVPTQFSKGRSLQCEETWVDI